MCISREEKLERLIKKYYEARVACNQCTELCLSTPYRGTEAAALMEAMYEAESRMFEAVGINYHGNHESGLRDES